jgi:hypothetical protein
MGVPMRWVKRGLVFAATGQHDWMVSHAANPVAEPLDGDRFRVYFGCRDRQNRSHVGWVEIEIGDTVRVLGVAQEPVVAPGPLGSFDDSGASMGCLVACGSKRYLYYLGWNLGVTVPWRNSIGLAVSAGPGESFVKQSRAPVVDRSDADPFSVSYPWVLCEQDRWRMWYGSNLSWGTQQEDMDHVLKYAESSDGIHWERDGHVALGLEEPGEYALCRPCVLRERGLYRMWYCLRGEAYRIGYAESPDGRHWERRPDEVGIEPSPSGWDSEMIAYPFVFVNRGRHHLLYNGNRYGRDGFGLAVAAQDP